tara:strand:+ start:257 stop:550 length:294 start_codon:yes stop_codon:yes gene_type:complete
MGFISWDIDKSGIRKYITETIMEKYKINFVFFFKKSDSLNIFFIRYTFAKFRPTKVMKCVFVRIIDRVVEPFIKYHMIFNSINDQKRAKVESTEKYK